MSARTYTFTSQSVEQTQSLAAQLASCVEAGDVVALDGDLGAGKTHFTQGLAEGLGVADLVTSPTFTVMVAYDSGRLPLYHFDLYRLEDALQLEDVAFYDYVDADGVSCVEWASKFADELPDHTLWLSITTGEDGARTIQATARDQRAIDLLDAWIAAASAL
ncbi:tRNA (adenosine(37)-N6)-threonylcarbamoyltransferase complex ATPase subunit type 1 TsaE [Anaerotardibacter muris]|uniref:tRNA (adenosine(37)-N6)-threonylcarbamoyltransferase complex ATPase subunit type 1 TsaE n=1 Tax=Anaerotardibacter muris TaxID=2941505 RepID=UPI00203CFCA0|nr:tRNA (adenosine(37)-N6)-threonylcarbamoyltransferase complex ATPase subunit type 1 TsaE [Anaerotardibacter muris]